MKQFDAVVIGAGNGGLVAAIRLLQGGAKVLLVEKHNLPGGFATSFRRGRFEFEASLHELNDFGTADNAGDVRVLFDELGVTDKIEWLQIPDAYRVIVRSEGLDAVMPFGVEAFIDAARAAGPLLTTALASLVLTLAADAVLLAWFCRFEDGRADA